MAWTSVRLCMHSYGRASGSACIHMEMRQALHAFVSKSVRFCMHLYGEASGSACIRMEKHPALHAFVWKSARLCMHSYGKAPGSACICMENCWARLYRKMSGFSCVLMGIMPGTALRSRGESKAV
eukprot:1156665-Pelagomonas_calceolata.AAC.4